jgi:ornithine cyclodeaminase
LYWLSQEDIISTGILDMAVSQPLIERTFHLIAEGKTRTAQEIPMPLNLGQSAVTFYSLPAYVGGEFNVAGLKWTAHALQKPTSKLPHINPLLILSNPKNGLPLVAMEGSVISAIRTGAVTATAVKYLASSSSHTLLCCGAGVQARQQIEGTIFGLPHLEKVYIWGRTGSKAENLVNEFKQRYSDIQFMTVNQPAEVIGFSDIVIGATSAPEPYLFKEDFKDGCLYCHIGFNDIDPIAINGFDKIVCDNFVLGVKYSGQSLFRLNRQGHFDHNKPIDLLEDWIIGKSKYRQRAGEKILFNAFGLSVFDLALGNYVFKFARKHRIGCSLSLWNMQNTPIWQTTR